MSKLVITYVCENRHDVETVIIDLKRRGKVEEEDIWKMMTRGCRCTTSAAANPYIPHQIQGLSF